MKRRHAVSRLACLVCFAGLFVSGCGGGSDTNNTPPLNIVHITEDVTQPTTWLATNLYIIDSSIDVLATLDIDPGTIVKFQADTSLSVGAGGAIIAAKSTSAPCVFTSVRDDAQGGDSNDDGATTAPAPGDWGYLQVSADGSSFDGCQFLYGGGNMPYTGTLVITDDAAVSVTNCTFAHNQGGTLEDLRAASLNAVAAGAGSVFTGNTFYDNDLPMVINGLYDVDDSNVFQQTLDGVVVTNTFNGIYWAGNEVLGDITWSNTEVAYVIASNPLTIPEGAKLTLGDAVTLKFDAGQRIDVMGTLLADGATEILFTSVKDDSLGGDSNGDGALTAPAAGDWGYVSLFADGSLLNRCRFSYAGAGMPYHGTVKLIQDRAATITNNTFSHNAGGTLEDNRAAALNLGGASAATVVTGNLFYDNDMPMVINGLVSVDGSNLFHFLPAGESTPVTNGLNGIFMDGTLHAVSATTTWSNTEVAYVINTVLSIEEGATLTLGPDVVVKLDAGRIDVMGGLEQGTTNTFTSLLDDTLLGDTNGDGAATTPADGDWAGINLCLGGPCSWADWGNILYATNP